MSTQAAGKPLKIKHLGWRLFWLWCFVADVFQGAHADTRWKEAVYTLLAAVWLYYVFNPVAEEKENNP